MSDAITQELQRLNYAKNVRLERLVKTALSELSDHQELTKQKPRSNKDVSSVFLANHFKSPQRLLANHEQTQSFIHSGTCTIEKACLRGRDLACNEKVILVTEDHGLLEGYVQETIPSGKYYNLDCTTVIVNKCET